MPLPDPPLDDAKRMKVMILLENHHYLVFSELARAMKVTRGGLFTILRPLEKLGYIEKKKGFIQTAPRVMIEATMLGLQALRIAKERWSTLLSQ